QETEGSQYPKADQQAADIALAAQGSGAGGTDVGVSQSPRQHADHGGGEVDAQRQPGQPQPIVDQAEGEHRHQPHEGDEPPAFGFHTADEARQARTGATLQPASAGMTGKQKGNAGRTGGTGQGIDGAGEGTEQHA